MEDVLTKNPYLRDRYHDYRRLMEVRAEPRESDDADMILCGTPVIFDKPYTLFKYKNHVGKDIEVREIIEAGAFDKTNYVDVPVKYNHGDAHGTPARTTSKTERGRLTINILPDHVEVRMNLLPTSGGKDLFLEVQSGTVPQMSWAFTERPGSGRVVEDEESITFYVTDVERIFDFSAVDFGANPDTSIYARRRGDLDERAALLDEKRREALRLKINIKLKSLL